MSSPARSPRKRPSTRAFVVAGLLVSLVLAGGVSYWASAHPDGLEHVAEQAGFLDNAEDSATADSPLADYQTSGLDGFASGAVAGLVGILVMAAVSFGLFWLLRRRGSSS